MLSKGFQKYETASDDHLWLEFWHNGKITKHRTKLSHGSDKDLEDFHIGTMAKQTQMDKRFFMEFAKCNKSQDDYVSHLSDKGFEL